MKVLLHFSAPTKAELIFKAFFSPKIPSTTLLPGSFDAVTVYTCQNETDAKHQLNVTKDELRLGKRETRIWSDT